MRKFRAYIPEYNCMSDPFDFNQSLSFTDKENNKHIMSLNPDKMPIMRYIGLTTPSGQMICEGDIIDHFGNKGKRDLGSMGARFHIVYSDEVCAFCALVWSKADQEYLDKPTWINMAELSVSNLFIEGIEIIGNIHENPELLKY